MGSARNIGSGKRKAEGEKRKAEGGKRKVYPAIRFCYGDERLLFNAQHKAGVPELNKVKRSC